MNSGMGQLA